MTIKIVTDSTCDLPDSIIQDLGITVIPSYININGKSYLDGEELSRQAFYDMLPSSKPHPTTSAPGTGAFLIAYQNLIKKGASGIISIHISHSLSNIVNVAQIAAKEVNSIATKVIDSGQLSLGLGLLVQQAAKLAKQTENFEELIRSIENLSLRTYAYARLDTLEYLRRSGRLSNLQHSLASMLNIRPIMKMNNGNPQMEIVRTKKRANEKLVDLIKKLGKLEQVGITHSNAYEEANQLISLIANVIPNVNEIIMSDVTPVLGTHVGPGAVCISCIAAQPLNT